MAELYRPSFFQPDSVNGVPLAGALLYFYQAGTTTEITTYQENALSTPHANPVVADASGIFAPIFLAAQTYKTVLKTSGGTTVQTVDNITAGSGNALSTLFRIQDATDPTKQLSFNLSGLTTGQTRIFTVTDANFTPVSAVREQVFTATGTYTPHAKMLYCIIECVGGGGGGGGNASSSNLGGAGGGGGGSYARLVATAATIGASQAVTIGAGGAGGSAGNNNGTAGGDTSVGSFCIGKGGSAGGGAGANTRGVGGAGGVAGTGDITIVGGTGQGGASASIATVAVLSGGGGGTFFGPGAPPTGSGNAAAVAAIYGGGGAGGSDTASGGDKAGAAGKAGIVIVTEFCSA